MYAILCIATKLIRVHEAVFAFCRLFVQEKGGEWGTIVVGW